MTPPLNQIKTCLAFLYGIIVNFEPHVNDGIESSVSPRDYTFQSKKK